MVVVEPPSDEAPAGIFEMRYTSHAAGAYKIFAVDGEQRLAKAADQNSCAAIPLAGGPALPSIENLPTITHTDFGDADSELRYVGGVSVE